MLVVSNTSPIWNLASIEQLAILHEQFPDIRIPQDVWRELQVGYDYPELLRIQHAIDAQWITVESLMSLHIHSHSC